MGVAVISGYQRKPDPETFFPYGTKANHTVAACAKHFVGYPDARTGRDRTPVDVPYNVGAEGTGTVVLNMNRPKQPRLTTTLTTPAMDSPHESLVLNRRRGLLGAIDRPDTGTVMIRGMDISRVKAYDKIVPIFITVDPERDTPAVIKQFVANFHPRIVGLTGSPQAIAGAAKSYAVYFKKQPPGPGGGYMVDHLAVAFLMGPDGAPIASLPIDKDGAAIAEQVQHWVR